MKMKTLNLILTLALFAGAHAALAQGTAFTYQGRLNSGGTAATGSYDFRFKLYADALGNTQVGSSDLTNAIPVTNGLFTTTIDFGAGIFTGASFWLEVDVKTNSGASYSLLTPLQSVSPTPYAITAANVSGPVPAAQIAGGTIGTAVTLNNVSNQLAGTFTGNGANVTNVNAAALNGLSATNFWQLGGNNVAAGQFLGSTNDQPLEIRVGGARAGLISLAANGPNIVFGGSQNVISNGTSASSILGGGYNTIQANATYSMIGGGNQNTISNSQYTSIVGGCYNSIQTNSPYSVILGGYGNVVGRTPPTNTTSYFGPGNGNSIVNGIGNDIGVGSAGGFIGGGAANYIFDNATYATIPGGYNNEAAGQYSFAAGQNAQALHDGAFVWADSQEATFSSTTTNEFSIRAQNGVRIQSDVGIHLNAVNSPLIVRDWDVFATNASSSKVGIGRWGLFMEPYNLVIGIPGNDIGGRNFQVAKYSTNGAATMLMQVDQSGNITNTGNLYSGGNVYAHGVLLTSDRIAKENFASLNSQTVLAKVAALPVTEWNYKTDDSAQKHIGPMAQDFHAAFGLNGADDTHISTVDEGGVALAAIQGLNQKVEEKEATIQEQSAEIADLKTRLEKLEQLMTEKLGGAK